MSTKIAQQFKSKPHYNIDSSSSSLYKSRPVPLSNELRNLFTEIQSRSSRNPSDDSSEPVIKSKSLTELVSKETESCLRMLDSYIECCYRRLQLTEIIDQCKVIGNAKTEMPSHNTSYVSEDSKEKVVEKVKKEKRPKPYKEPVPRDLKVTIKLLDKEKNSKHVILKMKFPIVCKFDPSASPLSRVDSKFKISKTFKINMNLLKKYLKRGKKKPPVDPKLDRVRMKHLQGDGPDPYGKMYRAWWEQHDHAKLSHESDSGMKQKRRVEKEPYNDCPPVPPRSPRSPRPRHRMDVPLSARFSTHMH